MGDMPQIFHTNGESFDKILRRARDVSQARDIDLAYARDLIAQDFGHQDFQDLVDGAIHIDEDVRETYSVERRLGIDRVIFDFEHLLRTLCGLGNKRLSRKLPDFRVETTVTNAGKTASGENALIHWVVFKSTGIGSATDGERRMFNPRGEISIGELNEAFRAFWKGQSSDLVSYLYREGFLDYQIAEENTEGDPDALLEIELRKHNLTLGDRKIFVRDATDVPSEGPMSKERCFINALPDGRLVASNGSSSRRSLKWEILSTEQLNAAIKQMKSELGEKALNTPEGEHWFLKRYFKFYVVS